MIFTTSLFALGPGCRTSEQEGVAEEAGELRALLPNEIVGTIAPGQTSAPIAYENPPRYRALSFAGLAGEPVEVWVRSSDGDAVAYLVGSRWKTIASNDDADETTHDARISTVLPETGTYHVVFRERDLEPATFTVSLASRSPLIARPNPQGKTTLSGVVRDPAGKNPLHGVVVYVPSATPAPMIDGPVQDLCSSPRSGSPVTTAITGADGRFVLPNVPAGEVPLVIQTGKWRRQVRIANVVGGYDHEIVDTELTRLPKNRTEGDIPKIAITTGACDALACVLREIGVEDTEFSDGDGPGRIHLYRGKGGAYVTPTSPDAASLWADASRLASYDMMLSSCQCAEYEETKPASSLANIVAYANAGGRIYASHYEYTMIDPTLVTPDAAAPWKGTAELHRDIFGSYRLNVAVDTSFPKGDAFAEWLVGTGASTRKGFFPASDLRGNVTSVNPPSTRWAHDQATAYLYSFQTPVEEPLVAKRKGKVVYSGMHVATPRSGSGFPATCPDLTADSAKVKAVEFMLFELGSCIQDDAAAPVVPPNAE